MNSESHVGISGLNLYYRDDGVYLSLEPGGPDTMTVISYIKRKNIKGGNLAVISGMISSGVQGEEKIAPQQEEEILNESAVVDFDERHLEAYLTLLPADIGGEDISDEDIKNIVRSEYDINDQFILEKELDDALAAREYFKKTLIAKGLPPEDGKDAELIYYFELDTRSRVEVADSDEKIDFRKGLEYLKVEKGQKLLERTLPTEGKPGSDVHGKEIKQRPGTEVALPPSKNTNQSDDKREVFSAIEGRLEMIDGTIYISPSLKIEGDVSMAVGNIDFDGDVEVKGNVNAGFKVNAGGDILVHGLVESAELTAGGKIVVKNGVSGADKAVLRARGIIAARYVERATLDAGEGVITEFALHSNLMSEGYVKVLSGKGTVIGGTISAGRFVAARVIGSDSGTATFVEIGTSPRKRNRLKEAQELLTTVDSGLNRMKLALDAALSPNNPRRNNEVIEQVKQKVIEAAEQKEELEKEIAELEEYIQNSQDGNIHVRDAIYPGGRITIGTSTLPIKTENKYTTYYLEKKEITTKVYSYSQAEDKRVGQEMAAKAAGN